jgi:RHS repeat-associated protein
MLSAMNSLRKILFPYGLNCGYLIFALAVVSGSPARAAVGRISGEFAVSSSGAATYTIPISVTEAVGGMRPNIALQYNSQKSDGLAGVGWRLAGFSVISRCGRRISLDGKRQGVTFTSKDRFCLDGQPLLMVGGSVYGGHGAEYRAEIHSYQKVTSHLTAGTGPRYFKVQMPSGLTYFYGDSVSSRIEAPVSNNEVRVWALSKVVDKFGNAMVFEYNERADGEYDPRMITWGQGNYSLVFSYAARPDPRYGFISGSPWALTKRLIDISYKFQGSPVHDYRLTYKKSIASIADTGRSRLESVTQCAGGDCLPLTEFGWGLSWSGWGSRISSVGAADQVLFDFDGDGDMDKVDTAGQMINLSLSSDGIYSEWQQIAGLPVDTTPCVGCDDFSPVPLDYNGDGLTDLLVVTDADDEYHVYVSNADRQGFWCGQFCIYDTGLARESTAPLGAAALDIDGDGLDDLVYIRGSAVKFRKNYGAQFGDEEDAGLAGGGNYSMVINRNLPQPDFDGDGRKDLLVASIQCSGGSCGTSNPGFTVYYDMYLSTGDGFSTHLYGTTATFVGPLGLKIQAPDINGDGLSDIAFEGYSGETWRTMISNGKGFDASRETSIDVVNGQFADYDGDGFPDLLENKRVYFSDGISYSDTNSQSLNFFDCVCAQVADVNGDGLADVVAGASVWLHKGGNHYGDLVTQVSDGLGNYHKPIYGRLSNSAAYIADRRTGIQQTMTTGGAAVSGDGPRSPVTRLIHGSPLQVVTSTEQSATYGESWPFTTTYQYWNAQVDMEGRGFLGFAQINTIDDRINSETTTLYHQDFPYVGRLKFRKTLRDPLGPREELLDWGNYSQSVVEPDGLNVTGFFVRRSSSDDYSYQDSSPPRLIKRVEHVYTWDNDHGAVAIDDEYIHTDSWEGRANAFHTRKRSVNPATGMAGFDTVLLTSSWCLGRANRLDVTKTFPDAQPTSETRTVLSVYDPGNCRLIEKRIGSFSDMTYQLKTSYELDSQGRTVRVIENDGTDSLPSRVTAFGYSPNAWTPRAVTKSLTIDTESDPLVRFIWNERLGLVEEFTNVQGLTTRWEHDGFGRPILEDQVTLGTATNISYSSCSGWCPADRTQYTVTRSRSDGFWSKVHHDAWGRQVGEARALLTGEGRQETYHGRTPGRKISDSHPFVANEAQYFVGFTYDRIGRLVEQQQPVDEGDTEFPGHAVTKWTHEYDMVKKRDPEFRSTWYLFRPDGEIHQVTEAPLTSPGLTRYQYTPFGGLTSLTDPDDVGPSLRVDYDVLGHPASRVDADAGNSSYVYNVFGELIRQQDDQGNLTTMNYDQLGRITSRTEDMDKDGADEVTTWTYVPFGLAGSGLLDTVTGPTNQLPVDGYSKRYTYSALAQVVGTTTIIDGSIYQTDYTYNAQGQVDTMTYPATIGNRPKFHYSYTNGYLKKIDQDGGVGPIYEVIEIDASAREIQSVSGGDFISNRSIYDRGNTRLVGLATDLSLQSGVLSIQDYAYQWDMSGNLTARSDQSRGVTEEFSYDELSRLTRTSLNSQQTQLITYFPDGRINTRSGDSVFPGVGTYFYGNGANSDAVTRVEGERASTYHYNGNGSMDCRGDSSAACTAGDAITWYSFGRPKVIQFTDGTRVNSSRFVYGPDRQRIKQISISNRGQRNIVYVDDYFEREIQGNTIRYRSNVFANGRNVYALHESQTTNSCTTAYSSDPYFIHRDHQGSTDRLTLWDVSGAGAVAMSYDAFGKRRNADWTPDDTDFQLDTRHLTDHGYTGHEHLDKVRLIHMNGRVQDPIVGRMISVDPLIGNLANPQSLNRYSYAINNPVSFTDPTGFCEAGSDGNEGSCPPLTGRQISLIKDLFRADFNMKGGGKVIAGLDTAIALGAYAASLGMDSWTVGSFDVVAAFTNSENRDSEQYSVDDGRGGLVTYVTGNRHTGSPNSSISSDGPFAAGAGEEMVGFGGAEAGSDMFMLLFGVSGSSGVIFDSKQVCGFNQTCIQVGFGAYLGITGQGIAGLTGPLEEGSLGTLGVFAVGSAGGGGFGTLDVNSSSLSLGAGFSSGIGGATGAQFCRMDIFGCN